MKKLLLLIIALVLSHQSIAQADAFITTWVTATGFKTLTLSAQPDALNYTINWGDGVSNTYNSIQIPSHTFVNSGEHTVSFTGTFRHLTFEGQTELKAVQQWGTQKWTSMANMFKKCPTFNSFPTQAPDLSLCTDMTYMFSEAFAFNQPLGSWDVSKVTNMSYIFHYARAFNQPIGSWDVSNVTTMRQMFFYAIAFNQPIGSWNVSKVTNMGVMFQNASAFNQNIGSWNVSKVTTMVSMFLGTNLSTANYDDTLIGWSTITSTETALRQNVGFNGGSSKYCNGASARSILTSAPNSWYITDGGLDCSSLIVLDTNGVTIKYTGNTVPSPYFVQANPRGTGMEWFAIVDNTTKSQISDYAKNIQSGITYFTPTGSTTPIPFNNIVTTLVTHMSSIFENASAFNQPIGSWDVSKVTDMDWMFLGTTAFNQPIDSWNVSNVTSMKAMFYNHTTFNQNIGSWDVSKVTDMSYMFVSAFAFNQNISSWNVSKVTNMSDMFKGAIAFNQPINSWNVSSVTNMSYMFKSAPAFNQPIDSWNVSNVTTMSYMFNGATAFNQPIGSWNVSNVTDMGSMFVNAKLSTANYDATLIGWATKTLKSNVTFSGGNSKYCNGTSARSSIINNYGWTIIDGGLDCSSLNTETFNTSSLQLYPNPVVKVLNVNIDSNLIDQPFTIIDNLGKVILKGNLNEGDNLINVEQLSKGIYYLKVSDKNASKFIK